MLKHFLFTVLVAMVPVIELRGAIPIGMAHGLAFWPALCAGVLGNLIPVPFIILFVRRVFAFLRQRFPKLGGFVASLERRAREKSHYVHRYEMLGLMILVAIPLPGTGAWTGALVAAMLNLRLKIAFPAIAAGVVIAGLIVSFITHGTGLLLA